MPQTRTLPAEKLDLIRDAYYSEGLSAREIGQRLKVSMSSVYKFLKRHALPRRTSTETNNLRFERKPIKYTLKAHLTSNDVILKTAGIMLYWGEGAQAAQASAVDFANSNPEMIKLFLRFLREICGVDEKKLSVYLYCYQNQNPEELTKFWSSIAKIPHTQFTKPYVRQDFKSEKIGKMKFGCIHIRYHDMKLLRQILQWISEFASQQIWVGTKVVKWGTL